MASTTTGGSSSRAGASSSSPSRPASSSSSSGDYHSYELLYSKSRVTLHPTPYSKDNIPGYLAILKRKKRRLDGTSSTSASPPNGSVSISSTSKADSPPKRSTTQDNSESILISWLPEVLVKDRSETAKFVDVELREAEGVMDRGEETEECLVKDIPSGKVLSMKEVVEDESILIQPPPLASGSMSPTSPASYAFSHPLRAIYSLQVVAPTVSHWYGSLIISIVGGETLPPLFFHDDESRSTILGLLRADRGVESSPERSRAGATTYPPAPTATASSSSSTQPCWGGDELIQHLRKYAFIHRSVHDHRIFLVNPSPEDLDMHMTPVFADDAVDERRPSSASMLHQQPAFPDDPFAPTYSLRDRPGQAPDASMDSLTTWAKTTRLSLLSSFSQVTKSARDASRTILTHPASRPYAARLPAAVQSFAQAGPLGPFGPAPTNEEVSKISQKAGVAEYDSARVYLAKWARLVAEEGERNKRNEDAKKAAGVTDPSAANTAEEGGLGIFEILHLHGGTSEKEGNARLKPTRNFDPIRLDEWHSWFSKEDGRPLITFEEVKRRVFARSLAMSTRKEAWPLVLGVIPWDLTGKEREIFWEGKVKNYQRWKSSWASSDSSAAATLREREDVVEQRHRIRVDCLRTDRKHVMFASGAKSDGDGGDRTPPENTSAVEASVLLEGMRGRQAGQGESTNPHVLALGEILLTYTIYDTSRGADTDSIADSKIDDSELGGYVQGMSDLCSPLYILSSADEPQTFWLFTAIMERMRPNFLSSQSGMKTQLLQLQSLIQRVDPGLYTHLEKVDSLNLFFCFRWLLIRFKREFGMEEVLRIWECCWAVEPTDSSSTTTEDDDCTTRYFHLFFCLSILLSHRQPTMAYLTCFDEVLQYFQGLSGQMDVEAMLVGAEAVWKGLRRILEKGKTDEGSTTGEEVDLETLVGLTREG